MKKILCTAILMAAASSANAASLTFSESFGLSTTNWTDSLNSAQFNPSLGTLTSVTLSFASDIIQTLKAENTGAVADTLTPVAGANFTYRQGLTTIQTLSLSNTGSSFAATSFDGTSDFTGTSGIDFGSLTANGTMTVTVTGPALAAYIGLGDLSAFNMRAVGNGSISSDNGNLDSSISTQARYILSGTYNYDEPSPPGLPAPASLSLIGVGVAAFAASRRRKAA